LSPSWSFPQIYGSNAIGVNHPGELDNVGVKRSPVLQDDGEETVVARKTTETEEN